jgi:hypothetical protein
MKEWVSLENSSLNKVDNILIEFPVVERLLENVLKVLLQFDSEYWIFLVECMPIYGIMQELDIYIDAKKNRRPLTRIEKDWMFDQRQAWDHKRDLAALEGRPPARFAAKQPNIINHPLIREPSVNSNLITISPPKRIIRKVHKI